LHKALRVALSSKARDGQLFIIDTLKFEQPKTKEMASIMNKFVPVLGHLSNILLVMPGDSTALYKSSRNLPYLNTIEARNLNPLTLLSANRIILSQDSLDLIQKQWGDKSGKAPAVVKEAKPETKKAVARKAAKASPVAKVAKAKKVSKKA
jgi:large subunit ribosomal protein L4